MAYSKVLVVIAIGDVLPQRKQEERESRGWTRHQADAEFHGFTRGGFVRDTVAICAQYEVTTRGAQAHFYISVSFPAVARQIS